MRKILIEYAKPGMILGKTVFTTSGAILITTGTQLRATYIAALQQAGVEAIYVDDVMSRGIQIEDLVSDETKYAAKKAIQESISKSKSDQLVNTVAIQNIIKSIVEQVMMKPTVMINMQDIRSKDEFLYAHSVNVCVLSVLIAKQMGYTPEKLRELAVGALMHDIGKVKLENNYYRHRTDFNTSEQDIYETHTRLGFEMLKKNRELSVVSAYIALAHHEKMDGTGFPLKQKSEKIHEFAKIVALINEYDNLLYNSSYGHRMKHYQILEYLSSKAYVDYDPVILKVFQENISVYPAGTGVVLNTGEKALVVHVHQKMPTRPIIRVIYDKNDQLVPIREIDLLEDLTVFIVDEMELA